MAWLKRLSGPVPQDVGLAEDVRGAVSCRPSFRSRPNPSELEDWKNTLEIRALDGTQGGHEEPARHEATHRSA